MPYNNVISRTDAAALIPEEVAREIIQEVPKTSVALQYFPTVPMARGQERLPVLSALAVAYFVSPTDVGLKQTTEVNWANVMLNVEEIACIVPIPQSVLDDAAFDIWGQIRPHLAAAIGRTLDAAVFFGTNKPATWGAAIVPAAVAAGNSVASGATAANGGTAADIVNMFAKVWDDGYQVNFAIAPPTSQAKIYNTRDASGRRLDDFVSQGGTTYIAGVPLYFGLAGLWPAAATGAAQAVGGDRTKAIVGVRQDITYRILDQAVIQDGTGAIQYNLAQQDMVAMRVVARYAWAVPSPITYDQPTDASRYPFAVLTQP